MNTSSAPRLLVTGAGGQLGRRVVELLLESGAGPVAAATRRPERLGDLAARGADVRRADFDQPASLTAAFAGIERLLLVSTDALDAPGHRLAQHRAAIAAAAAAGVRHVVYTSAPAPHPTAGSSLIDDHFWTEAALSGSGLDWTVLRNHLYTDHILLTAGHALRSGRLVGASGGRGRAYVTREDCARAAAAALASGDGHRIFEITGPAAVTQDEVAALLAGLSGRPVQSVAVTPAQLAAGFAAAGLPPLLADGLVEFDTSAAEGHHAIVTTAVRDLTGRAPQSVRGFLEAHRDALRAAG